MDVDCSDSDDVAGQLSLYCPCTCTDYYYYYYQ